jgi:hypothetical protein
MVTICDQNERFGQLINAQDPSDAQEHIMCGGRLTRLPRRHLVDRPR